MYQPGNRRPGCAAFHRQLHSAYLLAQVHGFMNRIGLGLAGLRFIFFHLNPMWPRLAKAIAIPWARLALATVSVFPTIALTFRGWPRSIRSSHDFAHIPIVSNRQ
jgi:hypothetical protein